MKAPSGSTTASRREARVLRLVAPEGQSDAGHEERTQQQEDRRPADGIGETDGHRPGDQHADPVVDGPNPRRRGVLVGAQELDRVGVVGDVLGGRQQGDAQRQQAEHQGGRRQRQAGLLRGQRPPGEGGQRTEGQRQPELGEDDPAAAASGPGEGEAVDQRCPEELERPGERGGREEADLRARDAQVDEEDLEAVHDPAERHAGGDREQPDELHPLGEDDALGQGRASVCGGQGGHKFGGRGPAGCAECGASGADFAPGPFGAPDMTLGS
jgi:hypothetical protein